VSNAYSIKLDKFLVKSLEKILHNNLDEKLDVVLRTTEDPDPHAIELQNKGITIRRISPLQKSISISIRASDISEIAKLSWVQRIEPVFTVKKG
jgi:hypothetical protein